MLTFNVDVNDLVSNWSGTKAIAVFSQGDRPKGNAGMARDAAQLKEARQRHKGLARHSDRARLVRGFKTCSAP